MFPLGSISPNREPSLSLGRSLFSAGFAAILGYLRTRCPNGSSLGFGCGRLIGLDEVFGVVLLDGIFGVGAALLLLLTLLVPLSLLLVLETFD